MQKRDDAPPLYPCMMQPHDLRRVHHPHDEHPVLAGSRVRRMLVKLAATVRR